MHIAIEAQRIFRKRKHGMDIVALELIKALQQHDTQNHYTVLAAPGPDRQCLTEGGNVSIIELTAPNYAIWEQIALPRALRRLKPNLLHCTANTAPLYSPVPVVLTLHDVIFMQKNQIGGTWYQTIGNLYRRWVVPALARKAKQVITVSGYEQGSILAQLPQLTNKLHVVYNGLSSRFFKQPTPTQVATIKQQYQLPQNYVLFLGNAAPKKNMERTVLAWAHYAHQTPNALPLVITDLNQKYTHKILEKHGLKNLANQCLHPGYIPHNHLPAVYGAASLFLYTSNRESFGLPILEALATGTRVITANTTAMPEVAGQAAILVNPTNVAQITNAIKQTLQQPLSPTQQQAGRQWAARFTWQQTAHQTLAIYQKALQTTAPKITTKPTHTAPALAQ